MTLRENIASIRNGHIEPVYFLNGEVNWELLVLKLLKI